MSSHHSYGYPITVSVATRRGHGKGRHGRRKLHSFAPAFPEVDGPGKWRPETPLTLKQFDEAHRVAGGTKTSPILDLTPLHAQREGALGLSTDEPLSKKSVHLAAGVDLSGTTLAVILEALESAEQFTVDIDDIKGVVSQLGHRIACFTSLDDDGRRHAERALYAEIVRRCTTLT
ncbi:hypothetical protein [Mycobacterium sp. Lab-001]|uniref:hypothetical protein n=1 Tax=Mycobacterium sp. Lab-001 TaxID=3410136 RepID=UPI003D1703DB